MDKEALEMKADLPLTELLKELVLVYSDGRHGEMGFRAEGMAQFVISTTTVEMQNWPDV